MRENVRSNLKQKVDGECRELVKKAKNDQIKKAKKDQQGSLDSHSESVLLKPSCKGWTQASNPEQARKIG